MKKMNNKGFLLAESLVVSTFVLTVLVLLFVQFRGLFNSYEDSYAYNTVEGIYNLNTMKKYVLNNENPDNSLMSQIGSSGYVAVVQDGTCQINTGLSGLNYCDTLASEMNLKTLLFTSSNISSLNTDSNMFTQSFKDFISRIENVDGESRLIGQFNDGTYATIVFDINADSDMVQITEPENIHLYVSNTGDDNTGDGTIERPFATLSKAYEMAEDNATIYVMDDITVSNTNIFDQNKNITITSYNNVTDRTSTIFRGEDLTTSILSITSGTVILDKIGFDGNNIKAESSLIQTTVDTTVNNATFRNGNNQSDYGGAIYVACNNDEEKKCGHLEINDGLITDNVGTYGGAIYTDTDTSLIINGGTITKNFAFDGSGGAIYSRGKLEINGGTISENTAKTYGGGLICKTTCNMTDGTITSNIATNNKGGGVRIDGTFTLNGGTISKNTAKSEGGISNNGKYTRNSGVVCGNTPTNSYETSSTCPN